jgi:hypothetical protein
MEPTMSDWQPIEIAPKDGTRIVIWNQKYNHCPIAQWSARDVDDDHYFFGWGLEGGHSPCKTCESDFIGWSEDKQNGVMPTHWVPLPKVAR